ncbi:MAG TPA: hypothetical protein VHL78_11275 [Actinomycetota bacterium]|nr:hypothetical protein [Actinomycetota bacterium]
MIREDACDGCQTPLELDEAYALHDGAGEAELRRWRCPDCGDVTEDVAPVDASASRVA